MAKNIWENFDFNGSKKESDDKTENIKNTGIHQEIEQWIQDNQDIYTHFKKHPDDFKWGSNIREILWWYSDNKHFPDSKEYFPTTKEHEDLIFGNKIVTLEDIKNQMLKELKLSYISNKIEYDDEYDDEYGIYDEDGHCSQAGLSGIISFWENFDTNSVSDIKIVASGDWDEMDLDGGRDYLLTNSIVTPMIFNYFYYTLKYTKEQFENIIYNSMDINEKISNFYPPKIPTKRETEEYKKISSIKKYPLSPGMKLNNIEFSKDGAFIKCFLKFDTYEVVYLIEDDIELCDDKYKDGFYNWDGKSFNELHTN